MIDKAHLRDRQVLFRLTSHCSIYAGIVKFVEDDGFWIDAPDLLTEIAHDKAWKSAYLHFAGSQSRAPVLFVPTANLQLLIAALE